MFKSFENAGNRPPRSIRDMWPMQPALDSLLQLSRLLAENAGERLSPRQVDYAQTLYSTAAELRLAVDRLDDGFALQPAASRAMPAPAPAGPLAGRSLLLAASDIRAIYILAGVLEAQGMRVLIATDEAELGDVLRQTEDLDAVLFDSADAWFDAAWVMHAAGRALPIIDLAEAGGAAAAAGEQLAALLRARLSGAGRN